VLLAVSGFAAPAGPVVSRPGSGGQGTDVAGAPALSGSKRPAQDRGRGSRAVRRPNIVMIMADDLSFDLLPFMPTVGSMARRGASFDRYIVASTLCCPSRATILTGRYPHSTGVLANDGPRGGYDEFRGRAERSTFATALDAAGYHTGMIGKHLNRYHVTPGAGASPVPPGWDEWYVTGGTGYRQYDYLVNENGLLRRYGSTPADYGTDVMGRTAARFIARAARHDSPFLLEVAPFSPHLPATPAQRHAADFPGLRAPRSPAFNQPNVGAPPWLAEHRSLTPGEVYALDAEYRLRAQAAATIDDLVATVRRALRAAGVARNTYLVFTSDNGYHTGDHALPAGKRTAFDSDIRVPLVVTGPGVRAGTRIRALASSTDLAPTFRELGRARTSPLVEGRSLVGWLTGRRPPAWRTGVLVDYLDAKMYLNDPDRPPQRFGAPSRYRALRTRNQLWVAYANGQREHYDLRRDPQQRINTAHQLSRTRRAALDRRLRALARCSGAVSCHEADRLR
jgi:arylsulfatase A-like enzyme